MATSKLKTVLGLIIVAGAAVLIFLQYQTQQKLRAENESLQQQIAQLKSASEDKPTANSTAASSEDFNELLRLRGSVSALRSQTNQIAKLEAQNQQLRQATTNAQEQQRARAVEADERKNFSILQLNTSRQYILGMLNYANDHQGQFPTNMDQMSSYLQNSALLTNMNQFEMVYTGPYTTIANPSMAIVVREITPWQSNGKWLRTYSFADGHSEVHSVDAIEKFDEWELQRVPVFK